MRFASKPRRYLSAMREIVSPLDGFASPFGPQRGFNPLRIFANDEPGVWFEANDATTLFTDVAGTTPVTAPGDAVALQLDKSQGLTLGAELVTNGDFATDTDWVLSGPASISSGLLIFDGSDSTFTSATQSLTPLTAGKYYQLNFTIKDYVSGGLDVDWSGVGAGIIFNNQQGNGNYSAVFLALGGETSLRLSRDFGAGVPVFNIDNVSVRELPGNHRTQATTAARPLYALHPVGGVRNLLEYTEEFDNAVWVKGNVAVTDQGEGVFNLAFADAAVGFVQQFTSDTGAFTVVLEAKQVDVNDFDIFITGGTAARTRYNFSTDSFLFSGAEVSTTNSEVLEDGWVRLTVTATVTTAAGFKVTPSGITSGVENILIRRPQLEQGSTATNYQRVGSFLDVSEEGKARRGRLWYNGTSHFMETGTITPGTDKVQVFAGVRKLSDAAIQCLYETSSSTPSNNGTIVALPSYDGINGSGAYWFAGSKGTTLRGATSAATFAAPQTVVHTHLSDISGDSVILRVDGVQVAQNTGDQGTGNYLAYPLYFGARGGTSLFYNGYEDTSIIRFGPNLDDTTISKVESYVASKTPEPTL
jgi:hypothetical protein